MTVGEKIQHYRKKFNLSQEELGQKLLVSRQTVSLWEMDKTLPTVDNLIRLKEIFSVSLDEMLDTAEPAEETPAALKETYTFGFDTADMGECAKKILAPATGCLVLTVLACVCLFVGFFLGKISESEGFWGSAAICLMSVCVCTAIYIYRIRVWKVNEKRFLQNEYSYAVYDDYFVVHIFRKGELVSTDKVYFYELEKAVHWPRHIVLRTSGRSYILKRCVLAPNSKFLDFCNSTSGGMVVQKPEGIRKIVSIALVVLSVCTAWSAWGCFAALNGGGAVVVENMQVFYAFLPIPAASVLYGLYLKKKRYKYLKNIVVGIIMAAFLCIYGSFSFMFNTVSYDDSSVYKAEELLQIDLPTHLVVHTHDLTNENQDDADEYIYYTSDVYYMETAVVEFEKSLPKESHKWMPSIPVESVGSPAYMDILTGKVLATEYHLLYNIDTGEYNQIPAKSGTYRYLSLVYNTKDNTLRITEYEEKYIK